MSGAFQAGNLVGLALGAAVVGLVGARASLLLSGALTALVGVGTWVAGRGALRATTPPADPARVDADLP